MIDLYNKYYLDDMKVQKILKEGIIVFDTSALLDLYYYSSETQKEIFDNVFKYLNNRLWIPSQVYFEYLKNRRIVSEKPVASYQGLITRKSKNDDGGQVDAIMEKAQILLDQKIIEIKNQLKTLKERTLGSEKHPYLSPTVYVDYEDKISEYEEATEKFVEHTKKFKTEISAEIQKHIAEIHDNNLPDSVFDAVQKHFEIGKEYSYDKMIEIAKEGRYRYEQQIPPGYEDEDNKIGLQKYGDLYVWNQILDCAAKKQKDFILVTNDVKIDWFEEDKKTPRFELLKEFNGKANKSIWLLSMKNFIWQINNLLDEQLNDTILADIDSVQENKGSGLQSIDLSLELIQEVFNNFLDESIYLIDEIHQNETIRLFNNPYLFEAENEVGQEYRIIATFIGSGNYVRMLHGMSNAFEIKKFYATNKEHYLYYNFIIAKNKSILEKCLEHLNKNKVKKMFNDLSIRTIIGYMEEEKICISKTNFSIK